MGAKILRHTGAFHPQTYKLGDILVRFLFESGDEIVEIEAAAAARGKHVAKSAAGNFAAVTLFESIEEEEAFCAQNSVVFLFAGSRVAGNHTQSAADCLRPEGRALNGLFAEGRGKGRECGEGRELFVEAGVLA